MLDSGADSPRPMMFSHPCYLPILQRLLIADGLAQSDHAFLSHRRLAQPMMSPFLLLFALPLLSLFSQVSPVHWLDPC